LSELYAYSKIKGDFHLFGSVSEWESQMDEEAAKDYLRKHVRVSIVKDYTAAESAYRVARQTCKRAKPVIGQKEDKSFQGILVFHSFFSFLKNFANISASSLMSVSIVCLRQL